MIYNIHKTTLKRSNNTPITHKENILSKETASLITIANRNTENTAIKMTEIVDERSLIEFE